MGKITNLAIRLGVASMDPNPKASGWDRLDRQAEDFAAESRAEVSKPKGSKR